jgi:hypothetical protein
MSFITFDFKTLAFESAYTKHYKYVRPVDIEQHDNKHQADNHEISYI